MSSFFAVRKAEAKADSRVQGEGPPKARAQPTSGSCGTTSPTLKNGYFLLLLRSIPARLKAPAPIRDRDVTEEQAEPGKHPAPPAEASASGRKGQVLYQLIV